MANMIDAITITRSKIYKGGSRLIYSDPDTLTSFPGRFESVMNATTFALESGWSDFGATTEDGVTLTREAELSEGIPLDQRVTPLNENEPEKWTMALEATLISTDLDNIALAWEAGTNHALAEGGGYAAQHALDLDAPTSFTERMLGVIQEDPKSSKLRMAVFRVAKPKVEGGELSISRTDASELPATFTLTTDPNISAGYGQFGRIYELD